MHDAWIDRLSEYLDGELPAGERAELEQHLGACADCRRTLAELEEVVAVARRAPTTDPATDLWGGIAARIAVPVPDPAVVPIEVKRPRRRQFTFTLPQLAAAAVLVMMLGAGGLYLAMYRGGESPAAGVAVRQPDASPAQLVSMNYNAHESAIDELELALQEKRAQLDPATVRVVEQSLTTIDRAIADARAALEQDPANPFLHRHLDGAMKMKIDILRRAVSVRRAAS